MSDDEMSGPLTDIDIRARLLAADADDRLVVTPIVSQRQIGSTSVDLRLGTRWQILKPARFQSVDPRRKPEEVEHLLRTSSDEFRVTAGQWADLVLHPGELMLALTLEYIRLPDDLWGQLDGRSTWARMGLQVHATAGMVDPGFSGYLTFELQNTGRVPLSLFPGQRVGQMAFFRLGEVGETYAHRSDASYSAQYYVHTKIAQEPEHQALWRYVERHDREE